MLQWIAAPAPCPGRANARVPAMQKEVPFEDLESSDLFIDCLYKGGPYPNLRGEVLSRLMKGCGNVGGFRRVGKGGRIAYVVLFTTMSEIEWPDYLDRETGIFRYYGDNRKPGVDILAPQNRGNLILQEVFQKLNSGRSAEIPPFFVFKKSEDGGRDMQFLGLAAPGAPSLSPDKELVAFWRTYNGNRFQNFESYFSILDTGLEPIRRKWVEKLAAGDADADDYAPQAWLAFKKRGRQGIRPLKAKTIQAYPGWYPQLQSNAEGEEILRKIRDYYAENPYGFELCATDVLLKMDPNFVDFRLTRPWRDGGRDAIGYYQIQAPGQVQSRLRIDCALEAKCFTPKFLAPGVPGAPANSVGVHEMSRLISRIRYREFGVMVTTSFVNQQAWKEVKEDGHPILLVTATNIAAIVQEHGIHSQDVPEWLDSLSAKYSRLS